MCVVSCFTNVKLLFHQNILSSIPVLFFNNFTQHHFASAFLCLLLYSLPSTFLLSGLISLSFTNSSFTRVLSAPAARPPLSLFSAAFKRDFIHCRELVFQAVWCFQRAKKKINITVHSRTVYWFEKIQKNPKKCFSEEERLRKIHKIWGAGFWHHRISYVARKTRTRIIYSVCVSNSLKHTFFYTQRCIHSPQKVIIPVLELHTSTHHMKYCI